MAPRDRLALPVDDHIAEILAHLSRAPNLVLLAPPGSGKTTRVPPALVASGTLGDDACLVLEPRRVAARAAARRVAEETGAELGGAVGYQVRFDRRGGRGTRLWYVTEGILTARLQGDPFLEGVGAVVLDEFHERSLELDLALALLREVQREVRPDLRIVVMSATLDPGPVAAYLAAEVVQCGGHPHPVEIRHQQRTDPAPLPRRAAAAVREVWLLRPGGAGDVLVFLPGVGDIQRTRQALAPWATERGVALLPLHGSLPPAAQDQVLRPGDGPRVVLATNVAESSVTVSGVNTVVDGGLAKVLRSDPGSGVDRLELERISRANADQRAGRAGRTGPGLALRLWTRHDEQGMRLRQTPEIHRLDLAASLLQVLGWGHPDPATFPWFETPPPRNMEAARELLLLLGAVDPAGRLTANGEQLRRLPLHPRLGRLVLYAATRGLAPQGALVAALLSEGEVLATADPKPVGEHAASDLLLRLERLETLTGRRCSDLDLQRQGLLPGAARAVLRAAEQIKRLVPPSPTPAPEPRDEQEVLLQAVLRAYPDRVGRRVAPGVVQLVGGRRARLEPGCTVRDTEFLVAARLRGGQRGAFSADRVEWASAIDPAWLGELGELEHAADDFLDTARGRVVLREVTAYRGLPLTEREQPSPPERAAPILIAHVLEAPETRLALSPEARTLVARCRFLGAHLPHLGLPEWHRDDWERALQAPAWAAAPSLERLRKTDLLPHLQGLLTWKQRAALDADAPARVQVPSGNHLKVDYAPTEQGRPPVLAVKIQELFGCREGPRVASGRVALLLHLLGPHGRPLQVTEDLASFWQSAYPEVRKEMRGRYPKHRWPEDPTAAEPSRSSISHRRR